MDGWDLRADYHLPIEQDVNIFVSAFEFENPESASSYKETGNKYGVDAKLGNFVLEGGYQEEYCLLWATRRARMIEGQCNGGACFQSQ